MMSRSQIAALGIFTALLAIGCDLPKGSQQQTATEETAASTLSAGASSELKFTVTDGPEIDWGPVPRKEIFARRSYVNQPAPAVIVEEWLSGRPNIEGKFVLVDFWATWCGPCRRAIPELNEWSRHFESDLVVVGLSDESREEVLAMKDPKINYYSAIDTKGRTKREIGIRGIPNVMLIDPSGRVCWQGIPRMTGFELTREVIQDCIDRYRGSNAIH